MKGAGETATRLERERAEQPINRCQCSPECMAPTRTRFAPGHHSRKPRSLAPLAASPVIPELEFTGETRCPRRGEWYWCEKTDGPRQAPFDCTAPGTEREILRPVGDAEPAAGPVAEAPAAEGADSDPLAEYDGAYELEWDGMDAGDSSNGAVPQQATCPACDGTGGYGRPGGGEMSPAPCPVCDGSGRAVNEPPAEVVDGRLREGVDEGDSVRPLPTARGSDGEESASREPLGPADLAPPSTARADIIDISARLRGSLAGTAESPAPAPDYPAPGSVPAVGIYRHVPPEVYHSWPVASNSILSVMHGRSPAHAYRAMTSLRESTPATLRGDALHCAVLEPDLFADRYVVGGACAELLKSGERKGQPCGSPGKAFIRGAWYCGKHGDESITEERRTLISQADYADCMGMAEAVRRHPDVANLLLAADDRELSIVFDWPGTSIRCKARVDIPAFEAGVLGDVKTSIDASERAFMRSVVAYGYHRQGPFYQAACLAHGFMVDHSLLIAVEPEAPYCTNVFRITDGACEQGRQEIGRLLLTWERCMASGEWPGYSPRIIDISLPDWAWEQRGY